MMTAEVYHTAETKLCVCSVVSDSANPMDWTAHQTPLSMGFHRQEYQSGWPFPPSGDHPNSRIKPASPAFLALAGGFLTTDPHGMPRDKVSVCEKHIPDTLHLRLRPTVGISSL